MKEGVKRLANRGEASAHSVNLRGVKVVHSRDRSRSAALASAHCVHPQRSSSGASRRCDKGVRKPHVVLRERRASGHGNAR